MRVTLRIRVFYLNFIDLKTISRHRQKEHLQMIIKLIFKPSGSAPTQAVQIHKKLFNLTDHMRLHVNET